MQRRKHKWNIKPNQTEKGIRITFIPSEEGENLFTDRDGVTYCQDYIEYLLENKLL